jgi:hypothetical protein
MQPAATASFAISLPLRLTRKAKKENDHAHDDARNPQSLKIWRSCDPSHAAGDDHKTIKGDEPMPDSVGPRHGGFAIRKTCRRSPIRRYVLVKTMTLPWLHNGPSFTGRGRRPAEESQGPSWPRSSAANGYLASSAGGKSTGSIDSVLHRGQQRPLIPWSISWRPAQSSQNTMSQLRHEYAKSNGRLVRKFSVPQMEQRIAKAR